jgi:predicted nucleic acid-binding protein
MRVFLDASVLFSAAYVDRGHSSRLLDIARKGGCMLLASAYALAEARRNLGAKAPAALARLEELVPLVEIALDPPPDLVAQAEAQGLPAKDAPILAAAIATGAGLLVTGDRRHFGALLGRTPDGVRVLSLEDGLEVVLGAAEAR